MANQSITIGINYVVIALFIGENRERKVNSDFKRDRITMEAIVDWFPTYGPRISVQVSRCFVTTRGYL